MYDLIIIGGGPAGLAAALTANRAGLNNLVLERGVIASTIYNYPIAKPLFSTSDEIELEAGALPTGMKPTREEVLTHYARCVARQGINIHVEEEVRSISRLDEGFLVGTRRDDYLARAVLVAVGGFGNQRRLGVPGEDPARVSYRFEQAYTYATRPVLVVGGGNSAAEAALYLADVGARVTLSLRRPWLDAAPDAEAQYPSRAKIKPWVREPLERAASRGVIEIIPSSNVVEIRPDSALLRVTRDGGGHVVETRCDHIFALIGADPDTRLLEEAGAKVAPDGRPYYDGDTYETTVPGLYVAGHITRELHMKNALDAGRRVVGHLASQVFEESVR